MRHDLVAGQQVRVFLPHVEKVRVVRTEGAIADAVGRDDRAEVIAHGVDHGRADAAGRRDARDDARVGLPRRHQRAEVRAPERGRELLDDEHVALGATLDRFGGWYRPWHYGNPIEEYWAVREGVSLGDVSTLGKMMLSGPDVVEALERLYPNHVHDIKVGRSRYVINLNERGHILDDGMIVRDDESRFTLTFTSGGAGFAEMWVRDWIETWGLKVHVLDRTVSHGAINVTGPLAGELLRRAGVADDDRPKFLQHRRVDVAGIPCHIMRLSFTGEASYELHHQIDRSVELWQTLMHLGAPLGIKPHGLQALFGMRTEKGHIIVGQDTELDSTPRRVNMDWAVKLDKPPYLCWPVTGGITFTFGGLKVNKDCQVVASDWKPMPGLYACGEMVGGLFHYNYALGSGLMSGVVFGRIAGRAAVASSGKPAAGKKTAARKAPAAKAKAKAKKRR